MENEIINNEEILETGSDLVQYEGSSVGKVVALGAAVGGLILIGTLLYKKAIKPAIAKAKAKKESNSDCVEGEVVSEND